MCMKVSFLFQILRFLRTNAPFRPYNTMHKLIRWFCVGEVFLFFHNTESGLSFSPWCTDSSMEKLNVSGKFRFLQGKSPRPRKAEVIFGIRSKNLLGIRKPIVGKTRVDQCITSNDFVPKSVYRVRLRPKTSLASGENPLSRASGPPGRLGRSQ